MPSYEAGTAWVQVNPSLRGWHTKIRAAVANTPTVAVPVTANTARAQQQINALGRGAPSPTVRVGANTAAAHAGMRSVFAEARRLDRQQVNVTIDASGVNRVLGLVGLLTAALAGVSAAGAPAVAVLAAMGSVAGTVAQGVGALIVGFNGVGDAVKALSDAETKAAAGTTASASARTNAAQAIVSAQRQVERATISADRAAVQGAQQVRAAEQDLTRAQRDARTAQEDLTRARAEAREEIEDQGRSLRGAALDEREAVIRLADAQAALEAGRMEGLRGRDLERLQIDAERAALALDEARDRHQDLRQEADTAARVGVEGSERVVAAQHRATDAAQRVRDSEEQLARTRQQAAWAQADAAAAVADAQRALANASADAGNVGSTALNNVKEAMEGLSPEARRFAHFLHAEVLPGLRGIRDATQATLLPRMETAMRNLSGLAPVVSAGLAETGKVLGDLAVEGTAMMASGPWRRDFATIMASNNRVLDSFGHAGLDAMDAMRSVTVAAGPMLERFADATEHGAALANQWVQAKRASGELGEFFGRAGDQLAELGRVALQVATGLIEVSQALAPLGMLLLRTVGVVVEMVGSFAAAHPELFRLVAGGLVAVTMLNQLGRGLVSVAAAAGLFVGNWGRILGAMGKFTPAGLAQTSVMQKVTGALNAAELAVGRWTDRTFTSTNAAYRAATTGARLGTVVTQVASALPAAALAAGAAAIAYDVLTVSASEAADAINKGGVEAEKTRRDIAVMEAGVGSLAGVLGPLVTTQEEATQAAKQQRDALGPLARAHLDVQQATNNYQLVLRDYSPASEEAKEAAERLADAKGELETQERLNEEATKGHTRAILEQQGVMQGALSSDLAYREAVERVNEQLRDLAGVTQLGTEQTHQLEGAIISAAEAAQRRALDNYTDKTSVEAVTNGTRAYNQALLELVAAAGTQAPPALVAYIQKLSESELAAIGARVETDHLGNRVIALPGGKHIVITTTAAQAAAEVRTLDQLLRDLPKTTYADVVLRPALQQPNAPAKSNLPLLVGQPRAGGATGAVVQPMAAGGMLRGGIAQVVPPNTPRLIGDRLRGDEFYLPDDDTPRSMAIGAEWARRRRMMLVPMAAGGALTSGATGAGGRDLFSPLTDSVAILVRAGLHPLAKQLTDNTIPILQTLQTHAERDTPDAVTALTRATTSSSATMSAAWTQLGQRLTTSTDGMRRTILGWQTTHNQAWTQMRARAGIEIGAITGPQFGALRGGLDVVAGHATRTADWWGTQMARLRGLSADPIRWTLQIPINRGLVPAWAEIDRFFALGRPWKGVPVGFAAGTEDHRAQIAHPGQIRIWAEPETGGEAYIPLAASKRNRSTAILGQVAHRFGYALEPRFFADGGLWRRMFGVVKHQFPAAVLTSGYRPGDPGYHGSGRATDLAGPMAAINHWLANNFANSTELIYTPGINLWRGRPHVYNAATRADHHDHVHWALANAAMLAGARGHYPGGAGAGADITGYLDERLTATRRAITEIRGLFGSGNVAALAERLANLAVQAAITTAARAYATAADLPGAGVQRWRPTVHQALHLQGQPRTYDTITLRRMQQESGGNPRAVNLWDSNARRGTPSKGLMQVIDPTFRRYRDPRLPDDIWHPLANISASMRYAVARYGSLPAAYNRAGGYDQGGWLPPGWSSVHNGTGRREVAAVFNRRQWGDLHNLTNSGGGQQRHYHLTVVNAGNRDVDLRTEFRRLEMQATL